eukprot:s1787_g10.t1
MLWQDRIFKSIAAVQQWIHVSSSHLKLKGYLGRFGVFLSHQQLRSEVLCPFFAALSALQVLGSFAWSGFTAALSCLMQPHFWLGLLTAFLLCGMITWGSCAEEPTPPRLRLVCSFESPLALQAWEVLKSTSTTISLSWLWLAGYLREIEHRTALALLGGRCPFRDVEEARAACQSRPDLVLVRHAKDCAALRKAYHDGQRQVHPDLLRLQHPACSGDILQACSIALNLALEARRAELQCVVLGEAGAGELFKKEQLSSLERQVVKFTQNLEELKNQITLLEAENEKLTKRHAKEMRRTSSTSSPGTSSRTLIRGDLQEQRHQWSGEAPLERRLRHGKSPPLWENPKLVALKGASNILGPLVRQATTPAMPDCQVSHSICKEQSGAAVVVEMHCLPSVGPVTRYASPQAPLHARQNAIECLNHFALNWAFNEPKFPQLQPYAAQYLEVLGVLANDQDPNVLKDVCKGFVCVIENQWNCVTAQTASVVLQYMLKACRHPEYMVRVEALEVWTPCTNSPMLVQCVWSMLKELIPVLLENMVYSQADYMAMEHAMWEDDNAAVPDAAQDSLQGGHKTSNTQGTAPAACGVTSFHFSFYLILPHSLEIFALPSRSARPQRRRHETKQCVGRSVDIEASASVQGWGTSIYMLY